jgi:hypothetical protein
LPRWSRRLKIKAELHGKRSLHQTKPGGTYRLHGLQRYNNYLATKAPPPGDILRTVDTGFATFKAACQSAHLKPAARKAARCILKPWARTRHVTTS